MQKLTLKTIVMLFGLLLPTTGQHAKGISLTDGGNPIVINEINVESVPRGSAIHASIDGHYLSVTFTQDIGYVTMELDKVSSFIQEITT